MTSQLGLDHAAWDVFVSHNQSGSVVNQGYMLNTDENGFLVWRDGLAPAFVPQTGNTEFALNAQPPEIDVAVEFEDWSLGAGFQDAPPGLVQRVYDYSQGVDASWGTRAYLSPQLQTGGAITGTTPLKFLTTSTAKFPGDLWAMTDTRFQYWNGSAWTAGANTGVSIFTDCIAYNNGTAEYLVYGNRNALLFTSVDGVKWQASGIINRAAFSATATANTASGTSITIATTPSADDVMIATIITTSNSNTGQSQVTPGAVTDPLHDGWTLITEVDPGGAADSMAVFWKRAGSSESNSYVFRALNSSAILGNIMTFDNCITYGDPVQEFSTAVTAAAGTAHSSPALTLTGNIALIVRVTAGFDDTTVSWTGGTNERFDNNVGNLSMLGSDEGAPSGETVGTEAHTSSAAVLGGMITLALKSTVTADGTDGGAVSIVDAHRFAIRSSESGQPVLWVIDSDGYMRNTTNPKDPTGWTAADDVLASLPKVDILGLVVLNNEFIIQHSRGLTSYDGVTVETIFDSDSATFASDAARPFVWVDGRMYYTYGSTLFAFDSNTRQITPIWPRGPVVGNSELNGTITSITGDDRNLYFTVKNAASNYYVMKGDPRSPRVVDGQVIYPFHTWAYRGSAVVRAALIKSASSTSFSSTNPQFVLGDDASGDYFILPRPNLRPEDDPNTRFDTTADRILVGPFTAFGAQAYPKFLTRGDVEGDDLDSNDTITLQYQEPGGSATTIVTANSDLRTTTAVSAEVEFTTLRPVTLLNNGAATTTPVWKGSVLHATPNPERKRLFQFEVKIGDNLLLDGGPPSNENARHLRDHLFAAVNERVTLRDRWGSSFTVRVLEVQGLGIRKGEPSDFEIISVTAAEIG